MLHRIRIYYKKNNIDPPPDLHPHSHSPTSLDSVEEVAEVEVIDFAVLVDSR